MRFELVNATPEDYDFVYELKKIVLKGYIEETWGWNEAFQIDFHKKHFKTDHTKIIVVEKQKAGTVDVIEEDDRYFISGLYLLPQFQCKGIGSNIVNAICLQAGENNKKTELEVLRVNVKAQSLYKKLGFSIIGGDESKLLLSK